MKWEEWMMNKMNMRKRNVCCQCLDYRLATQRVAGTIPARNNSKKYCFGPERHVYVILYILNTHTIREKNLEWGNLKKTEVFQKYKNLF